MLNRWPKWPTVAHNQIIALIFLEKLVGHRVLFRWPTDRQKWPLVAQRRCLWPRSHTANENFRGTRRLIAVSDTIIVGHLIMYRWPMTFREYIAQRRCGDNPQGDFVGDARRDRNFPDVQSWPGLKLYLVRRGACEEAIAAAQIVWQGYRAALRRQAGA